MVRTEDKVESSKEPLKDLCRLEFWIEAAWAMECSTFWIFKIKGKGYIVCKFKGNIVYKSKGYIVYKFKGNIVYKSKGYIVYKFKGNIVYKSKGYIVYKFKGYIVYKFKGYIAYKFEFNVTGWM